MAGKGAAASGGTDGDVEYAYKRSLAGGGTRVQLTKDGIHWQTGYRTGVWPYRDIRAIRMSYRPVSMQADRYRTDVVHKSGKKLTLMSTNWLSLAANATQNSGYTAFVKVLHDRVRASGADVTLTGGLNPRIYLLAQIMMSLFVAAFLGLVIRTVVIGEYGFVLFAAVIAIISGWQTYGFMRRNRPQRYTFETIPPELLPSSADPQG